MKLRAHEMHEPTQVTIGRLRTAINYRYDVERQLALFEKIAEDFTQAQLELWNYMAEEEKGEINSVVGYPGSEEASV